MPDDTPKRSLSEISHLFLSSVRDKQTQGAPRPMRIPPGQPRPAPVPVVPLQPVDLPQDEHRVDPPSVAPLAAAPGVSPQSIVTPMARQTPSDETGLVFDDEAPEQTPIAEQTSSGRPRGRQATVTAILASHLGASRCDRLRHHARSMTAIYGRVGLIEIGAGELRISTFEAGEMPADPDDNGDKPAGETDSCMAVEALEELSWDVDAWLIAPANPWSAESRRLLALTPQWLLLSTSDHDGVVGSYRLIKGLADMGRPTLSLAIVDAPGRAEAERVHQKLAGVCQQFLEWPLVEESFLDDVEEATETAVLNWKLAAETNGAAQTAWPWKVVEQFLTNIKPALPEASPAQTRNNPQEVQTMNETFEQVADEIESAPTAAASIGSSTAKASTPGFAPMRLAGSSSAPRRDTAAEVIDLPADGSPESILSAILKQNGGELVECPLRAPMCPGARLAITRSREIILLAVAREGLADLKSIGHAYRWISENLSLIAMAIPHFAIDPNHTPLLRLLVDHADASADVLHHIMQADHVTIQAYRKLRWGGKTGLFLEAA